MKVPETSNGACEELLRGFGQITKLADNVNQLAKLIRKGENVAPKDLEKISGQIKWWQRRTWKLTVVLLNSQDYYIEGRLIHPGRTC